MNVVDVGPEGLKLLELKIFRDERGYFVERFNLTKFQEHGLPCNFVQDNHSLSAPKVLRGMHYQHSPAQGKLVSVMRGRIFDVVVDLRKDSASFGESFSLELSAENGKCLWVPGGFAHGFCVLGEESADVVYKVDCNYNPKNEGGIMWNDADLKLDWPIDAPIISDKDKVLPSFQDYKKNPVL